MASKNPYSGTTNSNHNTPPGNFDEIHLSQPFDNFNIRTQTNSSRNPTTMNRKSVHTAETSYTLSSTLQHQLVVPRSSSPSIIWRHPATRHFSVLAPLGNVPAIADDLPADAGTGSLNTTQASTFIRLPGTTTSVAIPSLSGKPLPPTDVRRHPATRPFPVLTPTGNVPANVSADDLPADVDTGSLIPPQASISNNAHVTSPSASTSYSSEDSDSDHEYTSINSFNTFAVQWNIRGIKSHRNELLTLLSCYQPIVVCLQETNAGEINMTSTYLGQEYSLLFGPCSTNNRQGVAIAVKNGIPFERIPVQSNIQLVAIRIYLPVEVTVVSVYFPPSETISTEDMNDFITQLPQPILLLGDLNAHHPAWGSYMSTKNCVAHRRGNSILDMVMHHDMIVLNNGSHTRLDPATGNTQALDVSLCSTSVSSKFSWKVLADSFDSDHFPIVITTPFEKSELTKKRRWIYSRANWELYEHLTALYLNPGETISVERFTDVIIQAAEASIPKTSDKIGKKAVPWWNPEVADAVKLRRKNLRSLRRLDKNDPRKTEMLKKFQESRLSCRRLIRDAKQHSWEDFVQSINPESTSSMIWNRINHLRGKRPSNNIILNLSTGFTDNCTTVANALADEYEQRSSDANYPRKYVNMKKKTESIFDKTDRPHLVRQYNMDFKIEELMWALNRKGGKSTGNDDVGYPLLQRLPYSSKVALLELFNRIWEKGDFPKQWKEGTVIPIPKPDGSRSKPEGFRPITLLSCIGKLVERLVKRRFVTELESNQKLDIRIRQHAFRAGGGVDTY